MPLDGADIDAVDRCRYDASMRRAFCHERTDVDTGGESTDVDTGGLGTGGRGRG